MKETSGNFCLYLSVVLANLLALSCGIAFGWSSPVLPKMNENINPNNTHLDHPVTPSEESWIVSLLPMGSIFSPIFAGLAVDKIGRRKTMISIACPILAAFIMLAFARSVVLFYIARLIMGLGVGSVYMIVPMYIIEISEDHNRGNLGCLMGVFITLGVLYSYGIGPYLSIQNFCLACIIPLLIFLLIFSMWNPESPHYLAACNKQEQLKTCLSRLRNQSVEDIEKEMLELNKMVQEFNQNKGGLKELFASRDLRKALFITVGLIIFQQMSGINAVLSYAQSIFSATGGEIAPEVSAVIIGVVQIFANVVNSAFADKLGRRILLLSSTSGSSASLFALGLYFYLLDNHYNVDSFSWLPVFSLIVFIISFNVGLLSVPFTIMAELFPPQVKSVAMTITTSMCFIGSFITAFCFPYFKLFLGMALSFWIFAAICAIGCAFVFFKLPETKGKSLQDIQSLLGGGF